MNYVWFVFVLGRVLYGGFFIVAGINHFQNLAMLSGFAGFKGVPAPKVAVAGSGLLVLLGGLGILTGYQPTLGVICIVLFLVPVTLMMHNYWNDTDAQAKMMNKVNFQKNVALLGAALMIQMVQEPWPLSLSW